MERELRTEKNGVKKFIKKRGKEKEKRRLEKNTGKNKRDRQIKRVYA